MNTAWWVIAPILLPLAVGITLTLAGHRQELSPRGLLGQRILAIAAVVALLALAVKLAAFTGEGAILVHRLGNWPAPYGIVLVADRLTAWMLLVTALLALPVLLAACGGTDRQGRHFHALFQFQLLGLNGAFLTGDIFNLFVFFEILLLASYTLLLHGGSGVRIRAGLHFVVLNLAGSSLFLIAVGTLYGLQGTLNMADLAVRIAQTPSENLALTRAAVLLLFLVFALKAALLPVHLWLPATYAAASAPVAALFALMTKVGAYAMLRLMMLLGGLDEAASSSGEPWRLADLLLPLALLTVLAGSFGALHAASLREQSGHLVVASSGTLLTALTLGGSQTLAAGLYYLTHSTFAAAIFFLLAGLIVRRRDTADRLRPGPAVMQAPLIGGLFLVTAAGLAGLPPFSGFVGKFLLLRAALDHPAAPWVLGVLLVSSLMALIALMRSGSLLFLAPQTPSMVVDQHSARPDSLAIAVLMGLTFALVIAAGSLWFDAVATAMQLRQPELYIDAVLGATR